MSGEVVFEQRRNHRTQLIISTNDINDDGGYDTTTAATAKSAFAHVETTLWAGDPYGGGLSDGDPANAADDSNIALPLGPHLGNHVGALLLQRGYLLTL